MAVAAVAAFVAMLWIGGRSPEGAEAGSAAPAFSLPASDGSSLSLSDLKGRDVLLYFNEGVGCDSCFYQTVELEQNGSMLADAGLTLVPIVVNPMPDVQRELERFGIVTPYLVDGDRSVSRAYGVLGTGMHADLPGHGFVLIDGDGTLRWRGDYPSMYVATSDLLAELEPYLG